MDSYYDLLDLASADELDLSTLSPRARAGLTEYFEVRGHDIPHLSRCLEAPDEPARLAPVGNLFAQLSACCDEDISEWAASAALAAQCARGVRGPIPPTRDQLSYTKDAVRYDLRLDLAGAFADSLVALNEEAQRRNLEWTRTTGVLHLQAICAAMEETGSYGDLPQASGLAPGIIPRTSTELVLVTQGNRWTPPRYLLGGLAETTGNPLLVDCFQAVLGPRRHTSAPSWLLPLLEYVRSTGEAISFLDLSGEDPRVVETAATLLNEGFDDTLVALEAARELV